MSAPAARSQAPGRGPHAAVDDAGGGWVRATLGPQVLKAAGHGKWDSHQDHNSGDPAKEFEGRILSVGVEDSIALSPRLSLVAALTVRST